jgi:hypothetical protein
VVDVPYTTWESAAGLVVHVIVAVVVSGVPEEMAEITGAEMMETVVVAVLVPFAFVAVIV